MFNVLYRMTLQLTSADWDPHAAYLLLKPYIIPKYGADIEDETDTSIRVLFRSTIQPSEMKKNLAEAMRVYPGMHYADILYRYPDEMFHDRFVVWADGTAQEYTTHSVYEEDGEREKV